MRHLCAALIALAAAPAVAQSTASQHTASPGDGLFTMGVLLFLAAMLYMLPTAVACLRDVATISGIVVLNLFLGWTLIGWVVALVWACTTETKKQAAARAFDYDKFAEAMAAQLQRPPGQ